MSKKKKAAVTRIEIQIGDDTKMVTVEQAQALFEALGDLFDDNVKVIEKEKWYPSWYYYPVQWYSTYTTCTPQSDKYSVTLDNGTGNVTTTGSGSLQASTDTIKVKI